MAADTTAPTSPADDFDFDFGMTSQPAPKAPAAPADRTDDLVVVTDAKGRDYLRHAGMGWHPNSRRR